MNKSKLTEEQIAGIFEEAASGEKRQASQMPASLRPPGYQYNATTGLRTQVEYFLESSGWTLDHKQAYGYDSNLDYLTSATYSTSYTGSESWSYDAAGNRMGTGTAYDNLNRMESSPGYVYQNDVLGNRTWRNFGQSGVQRYVWDEVNRLKSVCGTSEGARYEYRADGMRMKKVADLTITWNPGDNENEGSGFYDDNLSVNKPTTRYFYDGQMPMEEDYAMIGLFGTPTVTVTQYGLGARGIDYIRNKVGSDPETIVFPIYDGHGNMIYTLTREANDGHDLGNERIYGAWGDLRVDSNPGDGPNTQYVGNLGHKKDNESGLTYMRARYYEPWTGRFISEDPARDGWNWAVYADNQPITQADPSGLFTFGDLITGALDQATIMKMNLLAARAGLRGGVGQLQKALMKWGEQNAEHFATVYNVELRELITKAGADRLQYALVGLNGQTLGIQFANGQIILKWYDSFGKHLLPNFHWPPH